MSELIKKKDETRELLLKLNPEQLAFYFTNVLEFNIFVEEVKQVMAKNIINVEDEGIKEIQHQNVITQYIVWSSKRNKQNK